MNTSAQGLEPAHRLRRLFATLIDFTIFMLAGVFLLLALGVLERPEAWEYHQLIPRVALLIFATYLLTQGYSLFKHGHTVGKQVLGLRIVNPTSQQRLPFWRLLWLRGPFLPMILLGLAGPLALVPLLDSLMIFAPKRRCLHDYVAGSCVVKNPAT